MIKKNRQNGGYTLLFAVLTSMLVLGVAVFIVDISRKQFDLSVSARNSIYSFYAADSGMECAVSEVNWDAPGFASSTGGTLHCGTGGVTLVSVTPSISPTGLIVDGPTGNPVRQWSGFVPLAFDNGTSPTRACAKIIITTGKDPSTNLPMKIIDSRGYNLCTSTPDPVGPDTTNPGTVERALRLIQGGIW